MPRTHKRRPESLLGPIREQIATLFDEADTLFNNKKKELAKRRVIKARKLAMKVQLRIPQHKNQYCRQCNNYLKIGQNTTIRFKQGIRIRSCQECGAIQRTKIK